MKQKLLAYACSLLFLLLSSLLISSILSGLYYYHVLSNQSYEMIAMILGILLFLIAGFMLGKRITKKALIHAFVFLAPFLLIMAFNFDLSSMFITLAKAIAYSLGTIVGMNRK